ncbi:MAG TPA: hypothetical protein VFH85_03405 [Gammaproteobacteria bacterium]|nr:hypothetical protein [Gammaproteobacteria bacterium]
MHSTGANPTGESTPRAIAAKQFRGYRLLQMHGMVTPKMRARVRTFWLREGALPDALTALRKTVQLLYVIENAAGEIVGVTAAFTAIAPRLGRRVYCYRTFVRPADRVPGLSQFALQASWKMLDASRPLGGPVGLVVAAENPKLERPGVRRKATALGWRYLGRNRRGQNMWIKPFS